MTNEQNSSHQNHTDSSAIAVPDTAPSDEATIQTVFDAKGLYQQVRDILDGARSRVARSVNSEMVRAYWQIGQAIVEHEQAGRERADYGAHLIESLAAQMKADGIKGFTA